MQGQKNFGEIRAGDKFLNIVEIILTNLIKKKFLILLFLRRMIYWMSTPRMKYLNARLFVQKRLKNTTFDDFDLLLYKDNTVWEFKRSVNINKMDEGDNDGLRDEFCYTESLNTRISRLGITNGSKDLP